MYKKLLKLFIYAMKLSFTGLFLQCLLFNFLIAADLEAQKYTSVKKVMIDIEVKDASLFQLFDVLEKKTDFEFTYDENVVSSNNTKITISGHKKSVEEILLHVSKNAKLRFKQINNNINVNPLKNKSIQNPIEVIIQSINITGRVISEEDDTPIPGVNILEKGTLNGTVTDADGNYKLDVADENAILVFSSIGFLNKEITVGSQAVINVSMELNITSLSEVVVTAFGLEREKKALGYSVQELKGDELTSAREVNVANYLTGKVAGVQVSNPSSGSGGTTNVTIRGNSSLSGNQPLYVIDGVPIQNPGKGSGGLRGGDNDYGDGIGNINPEDVESITVLKGPSASALYGSRGSNGVIVITTKSGKARKGIGVEFNSTTSMERINMIPRVQNKYGPGWEGTNLGGQFVDIDGESYETVPRWNNSSWGVPLDGRRTVVDPLVLPGEEPKTRVLTAADPNNIRDFWETGIVANNMISLSGGGESTTIRASFGNTTMKGITPNHSGSRNTFNLRVNSKLTDKLSIDSKANYINSKFNNRPALGLNNDNVVRALTEMGRYIPMDFLKKHYEVTGENGRFPGVRRGNPYYIINELKNNDERNRFIGYASLRYQFTGWLSLTARSGIDWYSDQRQKTWPVGSSGGANTNGRITENNIIGKEMNSDFLLMASGDLSGDFAGSFSVGGNLFKKYISSSSWDARDFKAPGVYHVSNAQDIRPSNSLYEKEIQSLYFMGQLAYKNYLFLDVTGRNDWSSALGTGNNSFFYPSVSLGWAFTDAFEISSNILTFGKLRASWAQVGNDSDPYLTRNNYASYTTNYNGQGYASMSTVIPAFDLKNELTESMEFGFDIRLFDNRIGLDVTYYDGSTRNQILPVQLPASSGYSSVVINAGEIRNSGLEIVLNANIVRLENGFNWNLGFNYARNRSEVVELAPGIETFVLIDHFPNDIEARPGNQFGDIIGYKYKRNPDGRKIVNSSGGYVREAEQSVLGNITPDWIGGLNNSFSYKGFFMNVLIDFVQGGELSSETKNNMVKVGTALFTEEGRRPQDTDDNGNQLPYVGVLDGVVEVLDGNGEVTGYTENTLAVDGQTYWANRAWSGIGEEFVMDASYITLREVMLGYNFSSGILDKTPFRGIRVSLVGRNLFYIQENMQDLGISPESAPSTAPGARGVESISMPTTRTFGVNVNLTF